MAKKQKTAILTMMILHSCHWPKCAWVSCICIWAFLIQLSAASEEKGWKTGFGDRVEITTTNPTTWRVTSKRPTEFSLESNQQFPAKAGDTFAVNVRIRVDLTTKALPELVCYDAEGREIPAKSSLVTGGRYYTTDWQPYRRVFPVQPGTASVRARIRASGKGTVELADLHFGPKRIDPYETGALITQPHPIHRNGVVLESSFGIVNSDLISRLDRDQDDQWALIPIDLDQLTQPTGSAVDWRTRFEDNPNTILWSDGAVLKSDSIRESREPDQKKALHFRMEIKKGPYRAWMNDPGRAVALSRNGNDWQRHEPGQEIELGIFESKEGLIEFWIDACYQDAVSTGPVYFDYVRLMPAEDPTEVERLFQAAKWKPSTLLPGTVGERTVEVTISSPPLVGLQSLPVRCGLPVPKGELISADHVTVRNASGTPIPSQCRVLASWPDGSAKWLFLDFFHDVNKQGNTNYSVAYGSRVRRAPFQHAVAIEPSSDGLQVDTGVIRFTVPRKYFGIIENVRAAAGDSLQLEPIDIQITETTGKVWRALDLPVTKLSVERADPLHAVIVAETAMPKSGTPSHGFAHRARIHAYANSPLVHIDYFIANTDSREGMPVEGSMSSKVVVKSFSAKVKPSQRVVRALHALTPANIPPIDPEAPIDGSLVQQAQDVVLANWAGKSSEKRGQVAGWISLELAQDNCLSAGVSGFAEQFPKAFRWTKDALQIDLWAEEGGDFDWIEGVGKTHQISLLYGEGKPLAHAALSHGPMLAVAQPRWYTASGAFGPISPAANSSLPAVEKTLDAHMNEAVIERVGLGFENYGDHSSGGYVKGSFLWDNNEYDLPAACLVHFARTGDRAALNLGLASALHYLDVDTIHYSSQHPEWERAHHVHSHATFGHHTAQGPDMHHAGYVQGLIWYSYLTGDPSGIEGAKGIADWVLRNLKIQIGQMERAVGHPLTTLNDVYEATHEDQYLRGAARLVDQAVKWEHPIRSGFPAPITESPAYYSGSPFCGGLLPAALVKFNSWANLPEIDDLLERVARWTLTDVWQPPANIVTKGGSPRDSGSARHIASHLRLMTHMYGLTDDPLYFVVPLQSVSDGFGEDAKPFGTRSTGLVFNYVPWFLSLLDTHGSPRADIDLEVTANPEHVQIAVDHSARVTVTLKNIGTTPISDLRASLHSRVDSQVRPERKMPRELQPDQEVKVTYHLVAPSHLNLQLVYNRLAYAHWCALYRRDNQVHLAHVPVRIELYEERTAKER